MKKLRKKQYILLPLLILFCFPASKLGADEGSFLVIRAIEEDYYDSEYGRGSYTSARIVTRSKKDWTYGKIEARISLPEGQGLWPAFWMMPDTLHQEEPPPNLNGEYGQWPASGEIDIMEARGSNRNEITGAVHYQTGWGSHAFQAKAYDSIDTTDFNRYAIEWSSQSIKWFVNDIEYFSVPAIVWNQHYGEDSPAPFDQPFYIILNLAVGGHFDGDPPPGADYFPAEMKIDYVRVWQDGEIAWEDNFNQGDSPDPDYWNYDLGDGRIYGLYGWGNNELQYYTDRKENVFIMNSEEEEPAPPLVADSDVFVTPPYNIPNPFSPEFQETSINFELAEDPEEIHVEIFSLEGYRVFETRPPLRRKNEITWDGRKSGQELSSGLYVLRTRVSTVSGKSAVKKRKILLLR